MNIALHGSQSVQVALLRRYLRAHKWRTRAGASASQPVVPPQFSQLATSFLKGREGGKRDFELYVLSAVGYDDIEIALPTEPSGRDFLRRIDGAISTLSAIEQRAPDEIIDDIRAIGCDRVFSRVPDSLVVDDAIHLEIAANHIRGMRNLLAANATTELAPTPSFPKLVKQATEYADNCRFGHTFRGSFGFTIESPLEPNADPTLPVVPEQAPFERRVIERFARGVQMVCRAVDANDTKPITDGIATGFSANACEQFAKLIEETSPGGMRIAFAFSSEWRTSPDLDKAPDFEVNSRHIEVTRIAAKVLRERPVVRPETITGLILDLHARHDPLGLFGGSKADQNIVVAWRPEGVGEIQVSVPLSQEDYMKAVDAHREGLPVTVSGMLEQRGPRSWVLRSVSNFVTKDARTP